LRRVPLLVFAALALALVSGAAGAGPDRDLDGLPDDEDNCAAIFNPDQADDDEDAAGNTCDPTPGIDPDESKIVLYLRDQRGRPTPGGCFEATIAESGGGEETRAACDDATDPGWAEVALIAGETSATIEQDDLPPGCAGGLSGTVSRPFEPGAWQVVDVRYRCGTPDVDRDYDGVVNTDDNCPNAFNPDQQDDDEDEIGNTCDRSTGVADETSDLVLYLRDQDGAALWNSCFKSVVTSRDGPQEPDESCIETTAPGWTSIELNAPDDVKATVVQTSAPPGCTGGLDDNLEHAFAAHSWRVVTVRYRCGAPATFRDILQNGKTTAGHTLRIVRATKKVRLQLAWPRGGSKLDVAGLGVAGRRLAAAGAAPPPLQITRRRTATSIVIEIAQRPAKHKPGKHKPGEIKPGALAGALHFTIVGQKLSGATRATTRVTQH
jgi:hypothetical protein